ncbi:hypothetical protein [Filimonas effusa]|uniref:Uncharacterized protein n=1 Tax=Filimonas effusa TaxID=2508721 RepID=A0A4Q1DDT5_9BACT|nr:hypothetical protein [Filimonas effusa]RXK86843.1 hypothetical protein ESB13_08620 [Filimonas effusa]
MKHKCCLFFAGIFFSVITFSQDLNINGNLRIGKLIPGLTDTAQWGKRLYFSGASENSDPLWIARYNAGPEASELRVNLGDNYGGQTDKFIVGAIKYANLTFTPVMAVVANGRVGINTVEPQATLSVNGNLLAKGIKIKANGWADYVFDSTYRLRPLAQVQDSIKQNKCLPGMPSGKSLLAEGLDLAVINKLQQEKIEELFLYMIGQEAELKEMTQTLQAQQLQIDALLKDLSRK